MIEVNNMQIEKAAFAFDTVGTPFSCEEFGHGHINHTLFIKTDAGTEYILQRINKYVFKQPEALMENVMGVTKYMREYVIANGGDVDRECLYVIPAKDGKPYYIDGENRFWRCYNFITDAHSCQSVENAEVFFNAAKAFGNFQRILADYPIDSLTETIPNFHNTVSRFADFKKAVADNLSGRASEAEAEIEFVLAREKDCSVLIDMLNAGELPLRVTHNDTKLNNVMFDNETNEGICVVDLDTVMPGLSLYDFGDSIRFGANTAAEDEKDLSLVNLSFQLLFNGSFLLCKLFCVEECTGSIREEGVTGIGVSACSHIGEDLNRSKSEKTFVKTKTVSGKADCHTIIGKLVLKRHLKDRGRAVLHYVAYFFVSG